MGVNAKRQQARAEKLLKSIGKQSILDYIRPRNRILSPYEMRQTLDPEATAAEVEAQMTRSVPLIEGLRNILVVCPVMVTWGSVGIAATAYQQSVNNLKTGTTPPPFFQSWQEGFPGLKYVTLGSLKLSPHTFTLSNIAFVDFSLLLLLVLLTAFSQYKEVRARNQGRFLERWLDTEIFTLSKDSLAWSNNPTESNPTWESRVLDVIGHFNDTLKQVEATVNTFNGTLSEQGETVQSVVDDASEVKLAAASLMDLYQKLIEDNRVLGALIKEMGESMDFTKEGMAAIAQEVTGKRFSIPRKRSQPRHRGFWDRIRRR